MFLPSISYLNISLPHKIKRRQKKIASLGHLNKDKFLIYLKTEFCPFYRTTHYVLSFLKIAGGIHTIKLIDNQRHSFLVGKLLYQK